MDQQPKIPTLKDAQKPSVKIKGLGAGLTLFDRLKQFKKKDLAFILAGLGTLFMAPLVEHFMMSPEGGDGQLQQGWGGGRGSGAGIFGGGGSPYESGNNSIASGGAIGSAGDIITPLNVRDPSSLVMGPGGAQQPPAGSAAAGTPPPGSRSDSDLKDALAGAASRAASAAIKKAPLPIPKIALGGSGLRGLGVAGGGSSAAAGLGPIRSDLSGQAGTGGGGLNLVRSSPGFRGAAGPRGSSNPTGLDGTKKAGERAGDAFSRTGSALNALNEAAKEQIPTGGSGFGGQGQGGAGPNDKSPGGGGPGGSKSVGESLAFIAAKERMMKNLELEFEKKKLGDPTLLWYNLRNDALKTISGELAKKFAGSLTDVFDSLASGPTPQMIQCGDGTPLIPMAVAMRNSCDETAKPPRIENCFRCTATGCRKYDIFPQKPYIECPIKPGSGKKPNPDTETAISDGPAIITVGQATSLAQLGVVCAYLDGLLDAGGTAGGDETLQAIRVEATKLAVFRDALYKGKTADCAKVRAANSGELDKLTKSVAKSQREALDKLESDKTGILPKLKTDAAALLEKKDYGEDYDAVKTAVDGARKDLEMITTYAGDANLTGIDVAPSDLSKALRNIPDNAGKDRLKTVPGTVANSRAGLIVALGAQSGAQDAIDGGVPTADTTKVMPQLGDIVGKGGKGDGTISLVAATNKKYADLEKETKVTVTSDPASEKYDPKKEGVVEGVGAIDAKVAAAKTAAKDDKDTQDAVKAAKAVMLGVRAAQTGWLGNLSALVTTARSNVPKK